MAPAGPLRPRVSPNNRDDGPAYIEWFPGERLEQWRWHGRLHRDDGPAVSASRDDGYTLEKYYRDGRLHRTDGPAIIEVRADGTRDEQHYRWGKRTDA